MLLETRDANIQYSLLWPCLVLCHYKRHALTHTFYLQCCTMMTHPHIKLSVEVMYSNDSEVPTLARTFIKGAVQHFCKFFCFMPFPRAIWEDGLKHNRVNSKHCTVYYRYVQSYCVYKCGGIWHPHISLCGYEWMYCMLWLCKHGKCLK